MIDVVQQLALVDIPTLVSAIVQQPLDRPDGIFGMPFDVYRKGSFTSTCTPTAVPSR